MRLIAGLARHVFSVATGGLFHPPRLSLAAGLIGSMSGPVLEEAAEDWEDVFAFSREDIVRLATVRRVGDPFNESFMLEFSETNGQDTGAQALVPSKDVAEADALKGRDVPEHEERPSLSQDPQG